MPSWRRESQRFASPTVQRIPAFRNQQILILPNLQDYVAVSLIPFRLGKGSFEHYEVVPPAADLDSTDLLSPQRASPQISDRYPRTPPNTIAAPATIAGLARLLVVIDLPVATAVPTVEANPHTIAGIALSSGSLEA